MLGVCRVVSGLWLRWSLDCELRVERENSIEGTSGTSRLPDWSSGPGIFRRSLPVRASRRPCPYKRKKRL